MARVKAEYFNAKDKATGEIKEIQFIPPAPSDGDLGGISKEKLEQIDELKGDLNDLNHSIYSNYNDIRSKDNCYMTLDLIKYNNDDWNCLFLNVKNVDINGNIIHKGASLTSYSDFIPSLAFYDVNKNLIASNFNNIYENVPINIPENAVYVLMNSSAGAFTVDYNSITKMINNVKTVSDNSALLEKCESEVINGYGLYTTDAPFYTDANSSVIRYRLEKNKRYTFVSGNKYYKLVNGSPDNYSSYENSNGTNEFTNVFGFEYCYVDEVDHGVRVYGRELYKKDITNTDSKFANTKISGKCNGAFVFKELQIRKGDIIRIKRKSQTTTNAMFLSNEIRVSSNIESEGLSFIDDYCEYVAEKDWKGFTTWSNGNNDASYLYNISVERNDKKQRDTVVVCASNSSEWDKIGADYICDGINDEKTINEAINVVKPCVGTVILCDGDYYVDSFGEYNIAGKTEKIAICVYSDIFGKGVTIEGKSSGKPQNAIINVRASAFNGLSDTDVPSVFGGGSPNTGYIGGCGFNLKHVKINLSDQNHKCIAVNYQHLYWGIISKCTLTCEGYGQDKVPVEGLIGLRGWAGWSDGSVIGAYDTYASGFRVAFQLGGEHVICERLGTRFCYTSYTFGEYPLDAGSGAQVHPITLINCCDEHQATLPKFYNSGNADNRNAGRCQVDFIGFNIEYYPLITGTPIVGAMEEVEGGWVGRIEYSIENNENNANVALPFWANGHGKNFRTLNTAQRQMGTTASRNTFAPNYMQQYFDTDLNKVVFCKEPSTKTWIDANGNVV